MSYCRIHGDNNCTTCAIERQTAQIIKAFSPKAEERKPRKPMKFKSRLTGKLIE